MLTWLCAHPPPKGYEISYPLPTSGLAGSVLFFPWGVSSLWAEPHRTGALISLNLCKILALIFWPWSLPVSSSRHHKAWMDVLQADRETSHPKRGPPTPWMDFHSVSLLFFSPFSHQINSALFTRGLNVRRSRRVGSRASAVFLWDFPPPTACGSARAAHLELFLQVLKFKIEVSSKTCRTANCDLGVKKEAVSSIWLPGKYSVERKTSSPASYIFNFFAFACF